MDFVRPSRAFEAALVAGKGHYEAVVDTVLDAKRSVWIATANLKELMVLDARLVPGRRRTARDTYRSVIERFAEMARAGIEIRILHAGEPSRAFREERARHPELNRDGSPFELRQCPRVHLKIVLVDAERLYLGSANWTGAGLGAKGEGRRNFELGLVTRDELMIDEATALVDHVWRGAACRDCKLRDVCPAPLDGPKVRPGAAPARPPSPAPSPRGRTPASRRRSSRGAA
jgi:phosphatidylserine/phosphatidylglycerophosphate/cardiolipin synthase-like enzyme